MTDEGTIPDQDLDDLFDDEAVETEAGGGSPQNGLPVADLTDEQVLGLARDAVDHRHGVESEEVLSDENDPGGFRRFARAELVRFAAEAEALRHPQPDPDKPFEAPPEIDWDALPEEVFEEVLAAQREGRPAEFAPKAFDAGTAEQRVNYLLGHSAKGVN